MLAHGNTHAKALIGIASSVLLLAIGLWSAPGVADASDATEDGTFTVSINVPLNAIEEGQYCVAYANVYNGTAPYEYEWSGTYFWGDTQVVDAYMWGEDGYVQLEVTDHNQNFGSDLEWLNVKSTNNYNSSCEG